jgi:hypothetical protein
MRLGELRRITSAHVHLEHGVIHVPGTKTDNARRQIPIEENLYDLLKQLIERAPSTTSPLIAVPRSDGKGGAADLMKKDLRRAGIDRAELSRDDAEHMVFTFHGLRHTAITHGAVAGHPLTWLLVVAGHSDAEMTRRYLDVAAVVRPSFGEPHPPLLTIPVRPVTGDVTEGPNRQKQSGQLRGVSPNSHGRLATPAGIPRYFAAGNPLSRRCVYATWMS